MNQQAATDTIDLGRLRAKLADGSPRQFWRSLDELAETDEFRNYVEREFPSQLAVWEDPVGRRRFLQLMAASLALAGVTGCVGEVPEKIVPYVNAPEGLVPGKPQYYATAMPRSGDAMGLLVESHMGRPTKVEGNLEHPASLGATDAVAQASILTMYDPDRSQTVIRRGVIDTWDRFLAALTRQLETLRQQQGRGLRILTEPVSSPTLAAQLEKLMADLPEARWHQYESLHRDSSYEGARLAVGRPLDTIYHFDKANIVVSLDADFLQTLPGSVRYARDFMSRRRGDGESPVTTRLYAVESTPTITGATADHRLPLRPHQISALALAIAKRLNVAGVDGAVDAEHGVSGEWLDAVVSDLQANKGASIVLAGRGQPAEVHALVHAINELLGNRPTTLTYIEPVTARPESRVASLTQLVQDMRAGEVDTLIILGGNPVYQSPAELDIVGALAKVPLRAHLSEYYDETSRLCDWHIPAAHYLESWSDARAYDGTATIIQPLISPLYGGRNAHELVATLAGNAGASAYELVQAYWEEQLGADGFKQAWRKMVHEGVVPGSSAPAAEASLSLEPSVAAAFGSLPAAGELQLEFRQDSTLGDGRYANNGWLQELPKPMTKLTWDNVAMLSPATAERLGVASGDVLEITRGDDSIEAPAWVKPGQADDCVSLTFGYGRTQSGRVGTNIGYNAFTLLPASGALYAAGNVRKTGRTYPLATTQNHHSMEGRDIIRVTTQTRVTKDPHHLDAHGHHGELPTLYPDLIDYSQQPNSWGMVIDQTACIGCTACVIACQAENNIPVVGKEQVIAGREMHWLRIDRYYHGELSNPETYFQPMMCVHCEKAPCEVVCPVAATVHDHEGTSNMVYNRCVGTRYCSNNCPYKVRRFNFLQFSDETTPSLKLMRNPDVTVRSRGVMEKCSYCIQRISVARIAAKKEDRAVRDGDLQTACQQACPTQAIVFGNLNQKDSQVNKLKASALNYGVLADLNTRPRTTYLPRIVNNHPQLPEPTAVVSHPEEPSSKDKAHS